MSKILSLLLCFQVLMVSAINIDVPISTAQGLAVGSVDPNWTISFQGAASTPAYVGGAGAAWKQFSSYANWISPPLSAGTATPGDYTFTTKFNLLKFDPSSYFLNAVVSSDNAIKAISINNGTVALVTPACAADLTYQCTVDYKFTGHFVAGTNTLSFTVNNLPVGSVNPVGLYIQFVV